MAKKKTHEEYIEEVAKINSNIEVIGVYINSSIKILHRCKKCGYEWMVSPNAILSSHGCPACVEKKRKTHEEYVEELAKINPNLEVLGIYANSYTKILHRCKIHSYEWYVAPNRVLCGVNCPVCSGKVITHEEYVKRVTEINPNIEVVGIYIDSKTKILHRCKIDNYEWYAKPNGILMGNGCAMCYGNKKKTHEEYVNLVSKINQNIEVLGRYVGSNIPILHKCKIDEYEWYAVPSRILQGVGCPKCAKKLKTHDDYVADVNMINKNIEVVGIYKKWNEPILHRCKKCGYEWMVKPNGILNGTGCPVCKESHGERSINEWLNTYNILYQRQKVFDDCKDKRVLPFDFYLPEYNICIEYQGIQHYKPIDYFGGQKSFESQVSRDNIKKEYCQKNNIILFAIPYFEDINEELTIIYDLIKIKNIEKGVVV